uniref:Sulfotransferase domain-containing protein n=1 Tax=Candidatus Kentrum sp. FW TaxID=2126338 RepID=A0A450SGE5_9GAMM|nr:MAG: Sulfotransferase domain-containing protein [Candidatus Kentron sp. FW]
MSEFRNPSFFSSHTLPLLILSGLKRLGLARQFFTSVMLPRLSAEERKSKAFAGYEPTAHDVFACTYSKSGTNWLLQVIEQTAWRGEARFDHIHSVVAWPDTLHSGVISLSDDSRYRASPTGLRAIKTHVKTDYAPYSEKAVYITVIRDPKEVTVSGFHFLPAIFGLSGYFSVEEWLEIFLSPQFFEGSWVDRKGPG